MSLVQDAKDGFPRYGAEAFTEMTNNSRDRRSWAYMFPQINRNVDLFPKGVNAKNKHLRKWSEVSFEYKGRCAQTIGICRYRLVTGEGPWIWCDLLQGDREAGKELCEACATQKQKLVYHTNKECPTPQNVHSLPKYRDVLVDGGRIDKDKQKARPRNRGEKESTMLKCKVVGCQTTLGRQRRFRNAENANVHLKVFHKLKGNEYDAMAYPVPLVVPPAENTVRAAVATAPAPINIEQAGLPGEDNTGGVPLNVSATANKDGASAADLEKGGLQSPPPQNQHENGEKEITSHRPTNQKNPRKRRRRRSPKTRRGRRGKTTR